VLSLTKRDTRALARVSLLTSLRHCRKFHDPISLGDPSRSSSRTVDPVHPPIRDPLSLSLSLSLLESSIKHQSRRVSWLVRLIGNQRIAGRRISDSSLSGYVRASARELVVRRGDVTSGRLRSNPSVGVKSCESNQA